jgi:uncharacterized caspase-like protein
MNSATSLTDAVKIAATEGTSLTDAVKQAARSGSDCTVISFRRHGSNHGPDARHATAVPVIRPIDADAPDADTPPETTAAGAIAGPPLDERVAEPALTEPLATPRRLRLNLRPHRSGPAPASRAKMGPAAARRRLRLGRGRLPGAAALRSAVNRARAAAIRLASVAALTAASLVATPSPVGSDRPVPAAVQKRVALVVGNSAYRYARKLDNPTNDAADIGAALKRLGFQVIEGFDLDKAGLDARIREFTKHLRGADVGVFFYAGHGLHVFGQNYLVPVDAQLTGTPALDVELVRLDLVHRTMEREARTNILFFDACRDSPFSDNLARAMGTRSAEIGRGLGIIQGGAGTLISFSTQPGTLALDGKGRNSPYSAALARQLANSHEDLGAMLIAVRNDVMKETDRRQVPWEHSALTGRFYFNPAVSPAAAEKAPPHATARATATASAAREAYEAWSAARDTTSMAVLEAFVARYRDTFYAELARARMDYLRKLGGGAAVLPPVAGLAPSLD